VKIGILALQGCVEAHARHLSALGETPVLIRNLAALDPEKISGLIIPGGESTTMLKLLNRFSMIQALKSFAAQRPVWGVCAGSILMAKKVTRPEQTSFDLIDMDVERNAYGRQLESFSRPLAGNSEVAFIRAPRILRVGKNVEVLEKCEGEAVWVRENLAMASTFHPELCPDLPSTLHRYFYDLCAKTENLATRLSGNFAAATGLENQKNPSL
jgi:pyridoxal 5'-phosphate synthase pdxT subunit